MLGNDRACLAIDSHRVEEKGQGDDEEEENEEEL